MTKDQAFHSIKGISFFYLKQRCADSGGLLPKKSLYQLDNENIFGKLTHNFFT